MASEQTRRENIIQKLNEYSILVNGVKVNAGEIAKKMFFPKEGFQKDEDVKPLLQLCALFISEHMDLLE